MSLQMLKLNAANTAKMKSFQRDKHNKIMDIEDSLKTLDLTNMGLDTLPGDLFEKKGLRHLKLTEGNDIKVADRYKIIDSLESLETIDDMDLSNVRYGIQNLNQIFQRRLQEMFLTKAASEIYNEESNEQTRIDKMVQLAKRTVSAGPEVLKDFKDYKIEKMIRANYDQYVSDALEYILANESKENIHPSPPKKRRGRPAANKTRKPARLSPTPMPSHELVRERKCSSRFKLNHLLQTHSKNNSPDDLKTKVWMCAFEPNIDDPQKTTNIVATCGGDSVCFIDCDTGVVLKKYKHLEEEFYCLCWTVLKYRNELTNNERKTTMLAVGGVSGDIKLIDPVQLVCFERVSYHKKPVDALMFHPIVQHWLFSGSEDRTIVLWNLGYPFSSDNRKAERMLVLKAGTYATVRHIAILEHGKIILGACDDGLYAWDINIKATTKKETVRSHVYHYQLPGQYSPALDSTNCINNSLIAVKRVQEGLIQIIHSTSEFIQNDLKVVHRLSWRKTETPFLKFNYNRGAETLLAGDDKGTIWMYNISTLIKREKWDTKSEEEGEMSVEKCEEKLRCENEYGRIFNHVSCSSSLKHIVAVTDNNVVAFWKEI